VLRGVRIVRGLTTSQNGFHLAALEEAEYEPVMLFLNHSCEPNVGFAGNTVVVAMRDIAPGEELTTDYALFDDHDEVMQCRCGTRSCRGRISGRDWQRPDLQRRYGRYFSSYLQRRFAVRPDPGLSTGATDHRAVSAAGSRADRRRGRAHCRVLPRPPRVCRAR
jgi:SET domain